MSDALGDISEQELSPYERCNLWLLYTALTYGIDKVYFIGLWDGSDTDGSTAHLYQEVNKRTGQVIWLDTRKPVVSIKIKDLNFDYGGKT